MGRTGRERERGLSGCGGEDRGKQRLTGVGGSWLLAGWLAGCGAVPACIDLCIDLRSRGERGRKRCSGLSGGGRILLQTLTPCSCPSGILYTLCAV